MSKKKIEPLSNLVILISGADVWKQLRKLLPQEKNLTSMERGLEEPLKKGETENSTIPSLRITGHPDHKCKTNVNVFKTCLRPKSVQSWIQYLPKDYNRNHWNNHLPFI